VSLQIKALEEDLGVQLFDRTGSRVAVTAAGRTLLSYAEQVHALLQRAEQ
jgi:DNA-binding transcriptional LysR family regulator